MRERGDGLGAVTGSVACCSKIVEAPRSNPGSAWRSLLGPAKVAACGCSELFMLQAETKKHSLTFGKKHSLTVGSVTRWGPHPAPIAYSRGCSCSTQPSKTWRRRGRVGTDDGWCLVVNGLMIMSTVGALTRQVKENVRKFVVLTPT